MVLIGGGGEWQRYEEDKEAISKKAYQTQTSKTYDSPLLHLLTD
jgi:hypothetical protein